MDGDYPQKSVNKLLICLSGPMLVSLGADTAPVGGVDYPRTGSSARGFPTMLRAQRIWRLYAGQMASVARCANVIGLADLNRALEVRGVRS
jgi:hypothetical protein